MAEIVNPVEWIAARAFGGNVPATGEPAQVAIVSDQLQVRSGGATFSIPIAAVRVREVGAGRAGIELGWDEPDGARLVHVFDEAGKRALLEDAALNRLPQTQAFRADRRRSAIRRAAGWSAITTFLLLPLLALLIFVWQADRIAMLVAERISIAQETELGEQAFASMRSSLQLQDAGTAHDVVHTLGKRLTTGSRYSYRFYVSKDDAVNAFALPGGIIVVNTGLIAASRRSEELAGVLAHEVQHVERRHGLHGMVKNLGLRGLWLLFTGDLGGTQVSRAALELTALKFSRNAEVEADLRGFDALVQESIDPGGMVAFFATLAERGGATPPALLSSHPASEQRQETLRLRHAKLGGRTFPPLQTGEWPPR